MASSLEIDNTKLYSFWLYNFPLEIIKSLNKNWLWNMLIFRKTKNSYDYNVAVQDVSHYAKETPHHKKKKKKLSMNETESNQEIFYEYL